MREEKVVNKLMYNKDLYDAYKNYQEACPDNKFLSFETFLILQNNLIKYINNPDDIIKKYRNYHQNIEIKDYECFEIFCKSFNLFPYDETLLDEYRKCENCKYCNEGINLIDDRSVLLCNGDEEVNSEYSCSFHSFDLEKSDHMIRSLRRELKN